MVFSGEHFVDVKAVVRMKVMLIEAPLLEFP